MINPNMVLKVIQDTNLQYIIHVSVYFNFGFYFFYIKKMLDNGHFDVFFYYYFLKFIFILK